MSCRGLTHLAPQVWQSIEVELGFTKMTGRPALSALATRILANCVQPASRIDRFNPALAATLRPGASTVPAAAAVMAASRRFSSAIVSQESTRLRAVLWWKSRRWLRSLRHSLARARRTRRRLPEPARAR